MSLRYANSYISVHAFKSTSEDGIQSTQSLKPRTTEISALQRMTFGPLIEATDTIGEALRAGKKRCARCCQFKEPVDFNRYKKGKGEYLRTYCKGCCVEMERTRRFSKIDPAPIYPVRIG